MNKSLAKFGIADPLKINTDDTLIRGQLIPGGRLPWED